ncbi:MAG: type IV pilus assembly protein PilM [Proteobacteria bacterium]|nr:type IV pilus assembly protein PilM [Pseudomonadota bacterium]
MFGIKDLFSKKQVVGLDVGSSSIKLVDIQDTPKGFFLNNFFQIPLEKGVIVDGVLSKPDILSRKIKKLFKTSGCKIKKIVTSLPGHSVIIKKVSFSVMEEEELRELISDEAEKYLPFDDVEEVNFDFQILGESDATPNQMEVILVAAKKDIIYSYTVAIENAGLKVVIMDVEAFALETMYETNYDFEEDDIAVLVNIGASMTNINVVKNGTSIFTRDFPMGGNNITEVIQEKMGVTFEEAEAAKLEVAKMGEGADKAKLEEVEADEVEEGGFKGDLISCAEAIFMEIERSVDYFRSTYTGGYIKQILISGGCAKIPGLASALSQRLNIETELINPFKNISYNKKAFNSKRIEDIGPMAAIGVGLALRRIGDK